MLMFVVGALVIATALTGTPASRAAELTGTCLSSPSLPCSATAGQSYASVALGAAGSDDERSVEAVLRHVVGPAADVSVLAYGLTGDADELDFTPNTVTRGRSFEWAYRGPASTAAYLTVKASTGFVVVGVAGLRGGQVDLAALLGSHEISHVSLWATRVSQTRPVVAEKLHGAGFHGNSRLAPIEDGTVACLHAETGALARCTFNRQSGSWLESKKGLFALAGQALTLDGQPGGEYVVASKVGLDGAVPCLQPTGRDTAGLMAGTELAWYCVVEQMLSARNVAGIPLRNHATLEVCTSSYPHPDGAQLTRKLSDTVYCYIGRGAALNDPNGHERDERGVYLTGTTACHVTWSNGYEVYAAKRPATINYPWPGRVNTSSPILWRPVSGVRVAN